MKKCRETNQKRIILETLCDSKKHLSADEIYQLVKKKDENIGRATVFRNLKTLVQQDMIGYIPVYDGADYYDYRKHDEYHFKCISCGNIYDTSLPYDHSIDKDFGEYTIVNHITLLNGICSHCKKEE